MSELILQNNNYLKGRIVIIIGLMLTLITQEVYMNFLKESEFYGSL